MGTPELGVRLATCGDIVRVYVRGEIDFATAEDLHAAISLALNTSHPSQLVVDLSGVTFCDSSGLAVLVSTRRSCWEHGVALILHGPDDRLRRTLDIAGLGDHFTIQPVVFSKPGAGPATPTR